MLAKQTDQETGKPANLGCVSSHFLSKVESLDKSASDDERPGHLSLDLLGHIAERLEVVRMLVGALHVIVVDVVLRVEQLEHALHQTAPEVTNGILQVHAGARVKAFQLGEQPLENISMLCVQVAVGAHEHLVQRALGFLQELQEKIWNMHDYNLHLISTQREISI